MTHDQAFQALQTALAAVPLAAGRSFPNHIPQSEAFPAIRWQFISPTVDLTICGTDEQGDDLRMQVDCFASEYAQLRALRAEVIAAVNQITAMPIYRASERELPFDADARAFRHTLDFIISLSNT